MKLSVLWAILVVVVVGCSQSAADDLFSEEIFDSPRIAALAKEIKSGDTKSLGRFWSEMEGKAPLVESIEGDSTNSWVTYIWRGDDATRCVNIQGGPASLSGDSIKWLMRLAGTNLWYRTERVPKDARYKYVFMINRPMRIPQDPKAEAELIESLYKPDQFSPHDGLVELPDAPPQPWIHRLPGVAEGKTAEQTIHSEVLKDDRKIVVYTPPGYDSNSDACGLLILFDGQGYNLSTYIPGPVILDNLIEKQKIPPLVAVFVQQYERNKELGCSELFAEFIAKELVPWVRANYRVSTDPKRAMVGGLSLGGVMASYCALHHSDVFGNVLSQSGAYWFYPGNSDASVSPYSEPGWLTRDVVALPTQPVRFYLEAGRFEYGFLNSLIAEHRRFRDVLLAKGYDVTYAEINAGHQSMHWRGTFPEGLIALTSAWPPP